MRAAVVQPGTQQIGLAARKTLRASRQGLVVYILRASFVLASHFSRLCERPPDIPVFFLCRLKGIMSPCQVVFN